MARKQQLQQERNPVEIMEVGLEMEALAEKMGFDYKEIDRRPFEVQILMQHDLPT